MAWLFTPKKKLVIAIIDKTMLTPNDYEHASFIWILNHQRYTKTSSLPYKLSRDYFGFFPMDSGKYRIKGLERFSPGQLEQLSEDCDMAYFADTYGIYYNEWPAYKKEAARSGMLYGGMGRNDLDFLEKMREKGKLVIAEFNTIGSPTTATIRNKFEELFGIRWTGWTGRYFNSFDTAINKELPPWLVHNYLQQHNHQWPFKKSGIALVNLNDEVVVLEDSTHLTNPIPYIRSFEYGQNVLHLPGSIKYDYWFDIIAITNKTNHAISAYTISVNANGRKELERYGIPSRFPAVIMHPGNDPFYYFCGDFSNNPVSLFSARFKGISFFKWLVYDKANPMERKSFFWEFYRPMITAILDNYYHHLRRPPPSQRP